MILQSSENAKEEIAHGDYTTLASGYSSNRPGYSETVLDAILGVIKRTPESLSCVDVGAGTGIWTRMLAKQNCKVIAVEPNDKMRECGIADSREFDIKWKKGRAEDTGLSQSSYDLVTMASSFHWTDFDRAVKEFARILKPGGWFGALWNPRLIEANPLLVEIEEKLNEIAPGMKRVSSGKSEFCSSLTDKLSASGYFNDVLYLEARHLESMDIERYIGIWKSVNDVKVQAGPERFDAFIRYLEKRLDGIDLIDATYITRAWIAQIKK